MAFAQNTKREREIEMATKKEKMISVNELEKAAETEYKDSTTIRWGGLDIKVKPNLTAEEARVFYKTIIDSSFNDDGGYISLSKMVAIRAAVISLYTDIRLPSNGDKAYEILFWTNLYDEVVNMIDKSQLDYIVMAADEQIKYICDNNIESVNKQIGALSDAMEELSGKVGDTFSGVTPEIMQKFILGIAEHGVDAEEIARAVVHEKYGEVEADEASETK